MFSQNNGSWGSDSVVPAEAHPYQLKLEVQVMPRQGELFQFASLTTVSKWQSF